MSEELMIKIDNVSKQYRLGAIGGGTLQGDIQSWWARKRGLEDPNSKIGSKTYAYNEKFMALSGVSFEVKKGERVGIIGHNGAGKSTLLKLLSRVTAPTEGEIGMNGRVTSMLEVGTGFHGELTGRENIYMNGAILGMNRSEIDAKMNDIIEFSECGKFIDTPVKRYSSGMFVKLAFSVAAHLDSEIMIMDEVLAVGDMAFQKKCLDKMNDVSRQDGRTILYVSHNMNTIKQLCDRCVVLDHGRVIFDGDVEAAISLYMGKSEEYSQSIEITENMREKELAPETPRITKIYMENESGEYSLGDKVASRIAIENPGDKARDVLIRLILSSGFGEPVTMSSIEHPIHLEKESKAEYKLVFDTSNVVPGQYSITYVVYEVGAYNIDKNLDVLRDIETIVINADENFNHGMEWKSIFWGNFSNGYLDCVKV